MTDSGIPFRRFEGERPEEIARTLHSVGSTPPSVIEAVATIISQVAEGGDSAVRGLVGRHDLGGRTVTDLRVDPARLDPGLLAPDVRSGLETAIANVAIVADAGIGEPTRVTLPQGHTVTLREVPVRSAAIYAPGGQAAYPSSIVMGVVTARAAGVERICVLTPPPLSDVVLGTCALCGVDEVYEMGGAHGVAAVALGTETIAPVDVIAGPGSIWAQEAKRQLADRVGIDGYYGPSDLAICASGDADPGTIALDLLAQGEHGGLSTVLLASESRELLEAVQQQVTTLVEESDAIWPRPAAIGLARAIDTRAALDICETFAPEHLQLIGERAEPLARTVRSAGCLLVGPWSGTAFGDYVAGSNHCLPTGGSARFASGLSTRTFRRRMSEVRLTQGSAEALAWLGAPVARAEGFPWHARSMQDRMRENGGQDDGS